MIEAQLSAEDELVQEEDDIAVEGCLKSATSYHLTSKYDIAYHHRTFIPPTIRYEVEETSFDSDILNPVDYFLRYVNQEDFDNFAMYTNIYALQKSGKNLKPTNSFEIKTLIGLHIVMGCLIYPRVRMYWDAIVGMNLFRESMTRDRFFQLRSNLHLVNNLELPSKCTDKMFKVRPLILSIRQRCLQLPLEEYLCVDEQIVPFKGKLAAKQYQREIYAGGTVRVNQFHSPPLISDKEIMKKERGFSSSVTSKGGDIVLTKWLDNRTVVMGFMERLHGGVNP
ncbi:hypothetical protein J437_LFUL011462 [Ladona fulva]|uniref:PiggyBac transposable element-derived protein domain-containing protein n=1 Tax=Ladona fulva TaxID=123851 RepID=A0A8K0KQT7_LADFU|nr:hypothetical protein J437_LFUL011462 [Ladona fulva]